jgi:hypothetical protein
LIITTISAANGEATGSAYDVETRIAGVFVDCGLCQGGRKSDALAQHHFISPTLTF